MSYKVDTDFFFVFSLLFLGAIALFVFIYVALQYYFRLKTLQRRALHKKRKQENYKKIESKYAKRKLSKLTANNQKLKINLKNDLEHILKSDENKFDHLPSFFSNFETIYPTFGQTLKKIIADITANELKLCAFLRLNLSSKEMCMLLNITPESVNKARYRLRKKLDMGSKDNLIIFLSTI